MKWFDNILKRGIRITLFSTGKPYDPSNTNRTSAKDDLLVTQRKHDKLTVDKLFRQHNAKKDNADETTEN